MAAEPTENEAIIESLSHEGRGITHHPGKIVFIDNALPDERVKYRLNRKHRHYNEGITTEVLSASKERVEPPCPHATICGGCSLQHLAEDAQIAFRQKTVAELLARTGKVVPLRFRDPLKGPTLGYRRKARLGVRYVKKKQKLLVGFREKQSNFLADIQSCAVLDPRIGQHIMTLAETIRRMKTFDSIPQIEVAAGDDSVALVFRHLVPLPEEDLGLLKALGDAGHFEIWLQGGGPETIQKLYPEDNKNWLHYALPAYALEMRFHPADFTQVNQSINLQMIDLAIELLDIHTNDHVLDLFCGLGNFTLPIARRAKAVTGVEGSQDMVKRARENAALNGLENTRFFAENLTAPDPQSRWLAGVYNSVLLDPPRTGAIELLPHLAKLAPDRIVYVSCNPATLARDAGILVHQYGYILTEAGIMDMFPHTSHVETIALFEKPGKAHGHHSKKNPSSA